MPSRLELHRARDRLEPRIEDDLLGHGIGLQHRLDAEAQRALDGVAVVAAHDADALEARLAAPDHELDLPQEVRARLRGRERRAGEIRHAEAQERAVELVEGARPSAPALPRVQEVLE